MFLPLGLLIFILPIVSCQVKLLLEIQWYDVWIAAKYFSIFQNESHYKQNKLVQVHIYMFGEYSARNCQILRSLAKSFSHLLIGFSLIATLLI